VEADTGKKRKPEIGAKMVEEISQPEIYGERYPGCQRKVGYHAH